MIRRIVRTLVGLAALSAATTTFAQTSEEISAMPVPTQSGYASVNGVEIYYQVHGQGTPIILLHGGLMSASGFSPIIDRLTENHQVIGIDLQGHGHTLPFDRPMTFDAMAEDVAGVIEFLDLDKPAILGYSMGATTGLRLALDRPDLVSKLVLASSPYAFEGWHDYNSEGMRSITGAMADEMVETPLYTTYAAEQPDAEAHFPILLDKIGDMMRAGFDYSAELADLSVPTMLVYGDWDAVRTSHAAKFFELLGGGLHDAGWDGAGMNRNRLAILPGLTHYTMITPELAEIALQFIDAE